MKSGKIPRLISLFVQISDEPLPPQGKADDVQPSAFLSIYSKESEVVYRSEHAAVHEFARLSRVCGLNDSRTSADNSRRKHVSRVPYGYALPGVQNLRGKWRCQRRRLRPSKCKPSEWALACPLPRYLLKGSRRELQMDVETFNERR